jgi:RHS repeat-associated protein
MRFDHEKLEVYGISIEFLILVNEMISIVSILTKLAKNVTITPPASTPASARNQNTYYLHDGLGSVTALVDADGDLVGYYDYGAFGDERRNTVAIENRYRYTSREFVEPNLYYYRARYMRPDLGRFVSMDPLKTIDGANMFGYVQNNPVMWVDPFGFYHCFTTFTSKRDCWKWCFKEYCKNDIIPVILTGCHVPRCLI